MANSATSGISLNENAAKQELSSPEAAGLKDKLAIWLTMFVNARQRSAMDHIARMDPELAEQIRDARD